jgi:cytochrome c oxidase assembly protein subunit 15
MSERWIRRLLQIALALALVVVGASSYLRLAGNGLGCEPWPLCYGTATAFEEAQQSAPVQVLRFTHRVTASAFLLAALALVALAWHVWNRAQRGVGVTLLAVTVVLAVIGRFTPSGLPWITWVNVLGGFMLVGLLLWLLPSARQRGGRSRAVALVLMALLIVQALVGTLLSTRLAAVECYPACAHPAGDLMALVNPLRAGNVSDVGRSEGAAALLQALHRVGGVMLVPAALAWAMLAGWRRRRTLVAVAALAALTLGAFLTQQVSPAVGAVHALAAALLLAGLAQALRPLAHGGRLQGAVE